MLGSPPKDPLPHPCKPEEQLLGLPGENLGSPQGPQGGHRAVVERQQVC